jgi:hypothetical protein
MREFRRWLKRMAVRLFVIALVLVLVVYGVRTYFNTVGTRELARATARLDREEAGWRLDAIESARAGTMPPPDQNSGPIVLEAAGLIAPEHNKEWSAWRSSESWTVRAVSPHLPREEFQAEMAIHKGSTAKARQIARGLKRSAMGYYPLTMERNPYMTLLPHCQKAREVAALLEYDALLCAVGKDPDCGIEAAHAALNVGRSIGDEPFLISQLVRLACCRLSTQSAMQVFAWGEPRKGLAELQTAYRAEADVPFLLNGLRGERAGLHQMFERLESGELGYKDLIIHGVRKEGPAQEAAFFLYKGLLPGDHAKALEILSAYIAAAKLPHHEQRAALDAIPIPPGPPDDFRYIITRLLIPACGKVAEASLRARAELLAASAAIACERFRIANGRWPKDLDELPKDLLPEIPIDPFTGTPFSYRRLDDGIAIYSVGDGDANAARRRIENKDPLAGLGVGFRLWNPESRRQPPLPDSATIAMPP